MNLIDETVRILRILDSYWEDQWLISQLEEELRELRGLVDNEFLLIQ